MARSTDGTSRSLWLSILAAGVLAFFGGLCLAHMKIEGPSVTAAVMFVAFNGLALGVGVGGIKRHLARAHTPDARASYPGKAPARLPAESVMWGEPATVLLHMSKHPGLYGDPDWLIILGRVKAMERTIATFRAGARFVPAGGDEEVTEVQLVRLPDGFEQLLVDLHREAYDACYNTRPDAGWLAVGDALESVLDAAAVPARVMRRPRGQFIPVRN